MFAKRFQVVMMLLLGNDYTTIKNRVRVTDGTIAKMNNWIEENRETLIQVSKRILFLKRKKVEKFEKREDGHLRGDLLSSVASEISNSTIRYLARRKKKLSLAR